MSPNDGVSPQVSRNAGTERGSEILEAGGDVAVAGDWDEVDAVDAARGFDVPHHLAGEVEPGVRMGFQRSDEIVWNREFRHVGRELAGHRR